MDCKTAQEKIMPYIRRELCDREAEEFIEHIRECKACSEELEVYYTIYYALEKLEDDEDQGSFDIKKLLQKDIEQTEQRIRNHQIVHFYQKLFLTIMGFLLTVLLFTGVQALIRGSLYDTTLYNLFGQESEEITVSNTYWDEQSEETTEMREPETNRKRQVIITTPETERQTQEAISDNMDFLPTETIGTRKTEFAVQS